MANTWATVYWQLGDTPQQLRRTVAMPDETVGTLMRRALEEASMMGFISEEDAFSKDVLENWQAYVQFQGNELPLSQDDRLDDRLPRKGARLLFRPSTSVQLRAAPLRLSLDGITYSPPPPKKGNQLVTWLLIFVMLLLLGAVSVLLWQRLMKPKPTSSDTPAAAGSVDADAGSLDASTQGAPLVHPDGATRDAGPDAGAKSPDGAGPDAGTPEAVPEVAPRLVKPKPRKAKRRRRRRRTRRKRRRKRRTRRRRRRRSKRAKPTRSKRSRRRKKRSKKRRKRKRSKSTRKPPPRR